MYRAPVLLGADHELSSFECRSSEQTKWLRHHARQSTAVGATRVLVVTGDAGAEVVAYYAWCMAQIQTTDAPTRLVRGGGRYPQPVALLARLVVDRRHEGHGLARGLLQDVFARLLSLTDDIGCRGLVVHAESSEARDYYLHVLPDFEASPTDDLHLVLLMKEIRRALRTV